MRQNLRRLTLIAALCACALLPGCAPEPGGDPLAAYGADAALPHVTGLPSPSPTPALPTATPAPTQPVDWAELPLDDSGNSVISRPTRRPLPASMDSQLDRFTTERQASERSNAGTLQANVTAPGMACEFDTVDGERYLYFTADDGRLYRERLAEGAPVSWETADAQLIAADCARNPIISLKGDLIYVCDGQLIQLTGDDHAVRTVLATFDRLECLTRWDDTLLFIAEKDGLSGAFALSGEGVPELIIPSARAIQMDVINRRIVALIDSGLAAYSLDGDHIAPMIDGQITAFCYSGADLYYSTAGGIYRLSAGGVVERLTESGATWLGCAGGALFYLDSDGILHRADPDGSGDKAISDGPAFNPTLLSDRIAYAVSPDGGLVNDVEY